MAGSRRGEEARGAAPSAETDEKESAAGNPPPAEDDGSLLGCFGCYVRRRLFSKCQCRMSSASGAIPAARGEEYEEESTATLRFAPSFSKEGGWREASCVFWRSSKNRADLGSV